MPRGVYNRKPKQFGFDPAVALADPEPEVPIKAHKRRPPTPGGKRKPRRKPTLDQVREVAHSLNGTATSAATGVITLSIPLRDDLTLAQLAKFATDIGFGLTFTATKKD